MVDYDSKSMNSYGSGPKDAKSKSGPDAGDTAGSDAGADAVNPSQHDSVIDADSSQDAGQHSTDPAASNQQYAPLQHTIHPDQNPEEGLILSPHTQQAHAPQAFVPATICNYCGAKLNAFFYFCTSCGTPYKDVNMVLSADIPRQLTEGELIRMKAPNVWPLFWTFVGALLAGSLIGEAMYVSDESSWAMAIQMGALFIATSVFGVMHWPALSVQFQKIGFLKPAAWIGLAILIPTLAVNYGYHGMIESLVDDFDSIDPMAELKADFSFGFLVFAICIFPAVVEEVAFRGLIQHWLQTAISPWRAMILASFLFAVMHASIISLPYLFGVGMLLGWTKWKTGSLYPAMVIHFLHNFAVLTVFE